MFIIDRFEGNWAIIEHERQIFKIPRFLLPSDAKEGDIINIIIEVNHEETLKRKKEAAKILENFFDE